MGINKVMFHVVNLLKYCDAKVALMSLNSSYRHFCMHINVPTYIHMC
ncbi:hypothetical protein SAMN04487941_1320 [Pontibacter akesuensis]|uniref:Uncharacterized protein n=1 Tax=Pontibacter akesuensis TaxID=388950 RepID=A0A1I7GWG1_9BACT|nr:hypothetical protein SAMN04487941_1320 [Pontibacter akesuensis]